MYLLLPVYCQEENSLIMIINISELYVLHDGILYRHIMIPHHIYPIILSCLPLVPSSLLSPPI